MAVTRTMKSSDLQNLSHSKQAISPVLTDIDAMIALINSNETSLGTITSPFLYKGAISAAADFPTSALVQNGWLYRIAADVIDNDATKTNTGQAFLLGQYVSWNGTGWDDVDQETVIVVMAATPYAVTGGNLFIGVQTTVIGGASVVNLPAAGAGLEGKVVHVVDVEGSGGTNTIAITPDGTDTINSVNAAWDIVENFGVAKLQCTEYTTGTYGWTVLEGGAENVLDRTHRLGNGEDHASVLDFRNGIFPAHTAVDHTAPGVPADGDGIIGCDSSGGAVAVNLAALATYSDNVWFIIKDEGGNAGTLNITITPNGAETINGVNSPVVINTDYDVLRFYKRTGGWFTW